MLFLISGTKIKKIQRFKIQRFKIQNKKIQDSKFNIQVEILL